MQSQKDRLGRREIVAYFPLFFELEEKLSRISEKQNETAREITQQAQDDKMAQKSSENPEKEAPEKLIDAVLTEVFS